MLLSVSYVLQLVKFTKPECPKKSGYPSEPDLRGIVEAQASSDYKCDFCADAVRAVPLSVIAEECYRALRLYYEESSQCDAVVLYERDPQGDDLHTTLQN